MQHLKWFAIGFGFLSGISLLTAAAGLFAAQFPLVAGGFALVVLCWALGYVMTFK